MENRTTQIPSLYLLKFVLALLVVCIHMQPFFSSEAISIVIPLARIGVPSFFMISGFFFYPKYSVRNVSYLEKQLIKIIKIVLIGSGIYLIYYTIFGKDLMAVINSLVSLKLWVMLCFFNVPIIGGHLWYLFAYICVLLFFFLLLRAKLLNNIILYIGAVALVLSPIIAFLCMHFDMPKVLYRNWFLTGIPFFILGMYVNKLNLSNKISTSILVISVVVFWAFSVVDHILLDTKIQRDLYFATPFLSLSVLLLFLKNRNINIIWLNEVGKRDSLWIYVFHVFVISILERVYLLFHLNLGCSAYIALPIVMLITIAISRVLQKIKLLNV